MNYLTDAKIASARQRKTRYGLNDGEGLWLFIHPSGMKTWSVLYANKDNDQKQVKIGRYPFLSLAGARQELINVKRRLLVGADPQQSTALPTLKDAVTIWYEDWRHGKSTDTEWDVWHRFENHVFPELGNVPLVELRTDHFEDLALGLQADGKHSTARSVLIYCKKVFRYRPVRKLAAVDPVATIKTADLLLPYVQRHRTRIPMGELPALIHAIDTLEPLKDRYALQLMLALWTRTMELLGAKWGEFDFREKIWRIPPERMKKRREHIVPLSRQVLVLLERIKMHINAGEYLFFKDGVIEDGLLLDALYKLGYKGRMTTHGFRGVASSYLNERELGERAIEAQLSHINPNASAAAYNSAEYMTKRREIMQEWADYLDTFR